MAIFPPIATQVRVIGGPRGSGDGPAGPTGPEGLLTTAGAAGLIGPTGWRGPAGHAGHAGLASALAGLRGATGRLGSDGYPGPQGPSGGWEFIPSNRYRYYENLAGFNLVSSGSAVGCKFYYTPKRANCILFCVFTGLVDTVGTYVLRLGIASGSPPAPNAGEFSGYGDAIELGGVPGCSIPFATMFSYNYMDGGFGDFPYPDRWFDLATYNGGGKVRNISCIVLEF